MQEPINNILKNGSGEVTGFSPQTIKIIINKICDYYGIDNTANAIQVITYKDKNDIQRSVLYANKNCCNQLAESFKISITWVSEPKFDKELMTIDCQAHGYREYANGQRRYATNYGSVVVGEMGLGQEGNDKLKCVTKAQRRLILQLSGLSILDETEVETINKQ